MTLETTKWWASHADLMAWTFGWIAALGVAQAMKLYIPTKTKPIDVKRMLNGAAIVVGGLVAFMVWPDKINDIPVSLMHKIGFAFSAGFSAPTAYTLGKALLEWRLPALAKKLSWDNLKN